MPETMADQLNEQFLYARKDLTDHAIKALPDFPELSDAQQEQLLQYADDLRRFGPVLNLEQLDSLGRIPAKMSLWKRFSKFKQWALEVGTARDLAKFNVEVRARTHTLIAQALELVDSGISPRLVMGTNRIIFNAYGSTPRYATNGESRTDMILAELP